jgi:AcrR family transcriptional regulator
MATPNSSKKVRASTMSKSGRTRRRIMDAAADVLARKGYAGTRLSDIAAAANVQAPAIYYYYESREALIEAVVMRGTREATNQVQEVLATIPEATATERLLAAVEVHLRQALSESSFTLASIRNAGQLPTEMRARQRAAELKYGNLWRELVEGLAREDQLQPGLNPVAAQMLIIGAMNWAPEWWTSRTVPLDEVITTAKAMIVGGLVREVATAA